MPNLDSPVAPSWHPRPWQVVRPLADRMAPKRPPRFPRHRRRERFTKRVVSKNGHRSLKPRGLLALNAPEHPVPALVLLATVLAQWGIVLVPGLPAALWFWGDREDRSGLLLAFCGAEVALGLNQITAVMWYHPRAFAVPIGRTLVEHVADSSFPSDHVMCLLATGLGLLAWTHHRSAGVLISHPDAACRMVAPFLGVHFPLDMLGAIPVACTGLLVVKPFRSWADETLTPHLVKPFYRAVFSVPIHRGWVQF